MKPQPDFLVGNDVRSRGNAIFGLKMRADPFDPARRRGFTMVEMLAVTAIILVLGSVVFAGYRGVLRKGELVSEISGIRQCLTAYLAQAADNDGVLMPGNPLNTPAYAKNGTPITGVSARRYVWRLAPYVNYDLHGSLLVNERRQRFSDPHDPAVQYELSVTPSFGLNSYCLGGYETAYQTGLVTRQGAMEGGGNLIVFASAGSVSGGKLREGHHYVYPPSMEWMNWTGAADKNEPGNTGYVHFRHDNKALVAHYGGHVTLKTPDELQDMRLWSLAAARADDPDMTIPY